MLDTGYQIPDRSILHPVSGIQHLLFNIPVTLVFLRAIYRIHAAIPTHSVHAIPNDFHPADKPIYFLYLLPVQPGKPVSPVRLEHDNLCHPGK